MSTTSSLTADVRRTAPEDVPGLRAAIDSVARERRFLALLEAPAVGDVASFVTSPHVMSFVAIHAAAVLGWADVQRLRQPGYEHRGVLGMGVVQAHRRTGIGSRLLARVIEDATLAGISRLELEVFRSNVGALRLYERVGFQLEGERLRARLLDDVGDDILLMSRWA